MRTPEDIKKGLKCCLEEHACTNCPYDDCDEGWHCVVDRNVDALAYIQQLESNQHKWRSPKAEPPNVDAFYAISKYNPEIKVYKKNLVDAHYTTEWLNIRNELICWMPIPEMPKEV